MKNTAITEGMTDRITEILTGRDNDVSYVFEKRCANQLLLIFGEDILQSFFDTDINSLYEYTEKFGIPKKDLNNLFHEIEKSYSWRNKNVYRLNNNKQPTTKKNNRISNIEKKFVDMAVIAGFHQRLNKEEIIQKIEEVKSNFITPGLEFSMNNKNNKRREESFLSQYSDKIEEAYTYADKMIEDLIEEKITSPEQLYKKRRFLGKKKDEILTLPDIPSKDKNTANAFKQNLQYKVNPSYSSIKDNNEEQPFKDQDKDIEI